MRKQIISKLFILKRNDNKKIVGFFDYLSKNYLSNPFIVIPPSYGETKLDSISLSYFLAINGFNVIRYDCTDHIGESDGEIFNFTLRTSEKDLLSIIDYLEKKFKIEEVGIVTKSLAARIAIRIASYIPRVSFLLCIGGIINLRATLKNIYQEDLVGIVLEDKYKDWKFADILGFEVSRDFLKSAILHNYHNLEGTIADFRKLSIPFIYLFGEKDVWVKLEEVKKLMKTNRRILKELIFIPRGFHQISENPKVSLKVFKHTVVSCKKYFLNQRGCSLKSVKMPLSGWIAIQNRKERERLKKYEFSKEKEKEFWKRYLIKYTLIYKSPDFREYLNALFSSIGKIKRGDRILDVGCGPAHLGAWFLLNFNKKYFPSPFMYIGLDFVKEIVKEAREKIQELLGQFLKEREKKELDINYFFLCADVDLQNRKIESHLPFKNSSFNKVVCSLLISYLKDAECVIKEAYRVLRAGGKMVLTSLKPYNDLSQIYRNFIGSKNYTEKDVEEARNLLSSAGRIVQKEKEGYYHFFSREELEQLVRKYKFKILYGERSFGNQVNIVVAKK